MRGIPSKGQVALEELVCRRYVAGETQEEIAASIGIGNASVWRILNRHGVPKRRSGHRVQFGEKNPCWRGDKATYTACHRRVEVVRGKPTKCETCGTTQARGYEWASISKRYTDIWDYRRLCRSCHKRLDKIGRNFRARAGRGQAA